MERACDVFHSINANKIKKNNWQSVEWNGKQYLYNSKTNQYKVRTFIMGEGWKAEKSSREAFQKAAEKYAKAMGK